jgi:hypothetical protein
VTPHVRAALAKIADGLRELVEAEDATQADVELVPLADAGIERRALRRLIREGRVRAARIGRRVYVARTDLGALLTTRAPLAPAAAAKSDPAEAARAAYSAPLRVVRGGGR